MDAMIRSLIDVVRISSVCDRSNPTEEAPYGDGVRSALDYVLDLCAGMGFRTRNCSNQLGWAEIGSGSPLIGVLVHLDTVPLGENWTADQGEIRNGTLYGRGVIDDKGPAVTCIYAMKDILDEGGPRQGRIRIIFGQAEETGDWTDMDYYLETEEAPDFGFTPDADFPLIYAEKGIAMYSFSAPAPDFLAAINGGTAVNVVPSSCTAEILSESDKGSTYTLSTHGKAAHGSMPELGTNAISLMMERLYELPGSADDPFLRFYHDCIGKEIHGETITGGLEDEISGKLTFNAGTISIEQGPDSVPDCSAGNSTRRIVLQTDIRYPVTVPFEELHSRIERAVSGYNIDILNTMNMKPVCHSVDEPRIQTLLDAYRSVTGDQTEPLCIGGGTYARAMDNIVAFGSLLPDRPLTEHQPDERVTLEDLRTCRKIYHLALTNLTAQ